MERKELEALGLEKEAIDKVLNLHHSELDPLRDVVKNKDTEIEDLQKASEETKTQISELSKQAQGSDKLKEAFDKFKADAEANESKYKSEIDRRDFEKVLAGEITKRGGKSVIKKLINYDEFKESNDRTADLSKKLDELKESEDTKVLFEPTKLDEKNVGGESIGGEEPKPKTDMPTFF